MMRKFLLLLLLPVLWAGGSSGQTSVTIGTGSTTNQSLPIDPYYGYSYSQVIYLQSEIALSGNITTLSWYYNGGSNLSNSDEWTIYMGHTTKSTFTGTSDWVPVASLTQVWSGTITNTTSAGWITIDITDFSYNNTNNLIIAVDENATSFNNSSDEFRCSSVVGNRSIVYYNDNTNPNPSSPPTASSTKAYIPNLKMEIVTSLCSGSPDPGNTLSSSNPVCPGTSFTLSLQNPTSGSGVSYQWQSSTDGSSWSDINGATAATLAQTQSSASYYRCNVTCSASSSTVASNSLQVGISGVSYASLPVSESFESWSTICGSGTYNSPGINWANTPTTGNNSWRRNDQGSDASWTSTTGIYSPTYAAGSYSARFHSYNTSTGTQGSLNLYVDCSTGNSYKQLSFSYINASGTDVLGVYLSTDGGSNFNQIGTNLTTSATWSTNTFIISSTSPTTIVRLLATSNLNSYDIGIDNLSLVSLDNCTGTPTAGTATASVSSATCSTNSTLSLTGYSNNVGGITFQWQSSDDAINWSDIAGANSTTYAATNIISTTYYRCNVTCTNSGETAASVRDTVTILEPAGGTAAANPSSFACSGTTSLSLSGYTNSGVSYLWQASPAGQNSWTNTALTSASGTSPSISESTDFRCQITCNSPAGSTVVYSSSVSVTVNEVAGGTTASDVNPVCSGSYFTLSLTGNTTSGVTYQWQSSTDNVSYSNLSGSTLSTKYTFLTASTWYRCQITCTATADIVYSTPLLVSLNTVSYASLPFSESFESWSTLCGSGTYNSPGTNWTNTPVTGNNSWRRNDQGSDASWTNPTYGIYSSVSSNGSYSARFHSYNATNGSQGSLDLYLDCSTGNSSKQLSFDYRNNSGTDNLGIYLSTDGGSSFSQLGSNFILAASWTTQILSFSSSSATTILRFKATSDAGTSDIGVDNLSIFSLENCTGSPTAGTASASVTSATCSTNSTLSLSGYSSSILGIEFQWQSSTDQNTWNSIPGATSTSYTATNIISTSYYRCNVTCSYSSETVASNTVTVTINVPIGGTASANPETLTCQGTSALSLSGHTTTGVTYLWQSSPQGQNTWSGTGLTSASVTSPTITDDTDFRCQITCNSPAGSTIVYSSLISVIVNPVTAGATASSANPVCPDVNFTLSLTGNSTSGVTYQWQKSTDNQSYSDVSGATSSTLIQTLTSSAYYRCNVTCTNTSVTESSTPLHITMSNGIYASLPVSEGFESWTSSCSGTSNIPATSWRNTPATGNDSWRRNDQGSTAAWANSTSGIYSPAYTSGSYSARFHSYSSQNGTGTLDLYIDCSSGGSTKKLQFDYINTSGSDVLGVWISTDGGANFTQSGSNCTTAASWTSKSFLFTSTSPETVVRLKATGDYGTTDIGVDNLQVFAPEEMAFSSCTTTQTLTSPVDAGTSSQRIIGIEVVTTGLLSALEVGKFTLNANGTTSISDISNGKLWYTGTSSTFATNSQFGSTIASPTTSNFDITGSQVLAEGTNYFWFTYDINSTAINANVCDAECTNITINNIDHTPTATAPAGTRSITNKTITSVSGTQTNSTYVLRGSTNNEVLRIDFVVAGPSTGSILLNAINVNYTGTASIDVPASGVKLYRTTTSYFSTANLLGTAQSISNGIASFSNLNFNIPAGNSYVWVAIDVDAAASLLNVIDARVNTQEIYIAGTAYNGSPVDPAGTRIIKGAFNGNYTVGTGGQYSSFTRSDGIFSDINSFGLAGNVTLKVVSDISTENGSVALNQWTESGGSNYTLSIVPADASLKTISGSYGGGLIRINGADRVTIDGNFDNDGQYLKFSNTNLSTSNYTFYLLNTAASNSIKNCVIYSTYRPIYTTSADNTLIEGNNIYGDSLGNSNIIQAGIYIASNSINTKIRKNKIHDFYYTGSGYGCFGIYYASNATTVTEISNNSIYAIKSGGNQTYIYSNPAGIYISDASSGGNIQIYFNSIYMAGNVLGTSGYTGFGSCIAIAANATLLDIRNNILQNSMGRASSGSTTDKAYLIYSLSASTAFTSIDYNNYYFTDQSNVNEFIGYLGSDKADIAAWKAATAQDSHSYNTNPGFTSTSNLAPVSGSFVPGVTIASVSTDILDATRSNPPDLGAYEGFETTSWTGSTSSAWSNPDNWNGGIPTASTDVVIPTGLNNYPTLTSSVSCKDILIESGASLVGTDYLTMYGTATVEQDITGYSSGSNGWNLISSPTTGTEISTSNAVSGSYDFYAYSETSNIWLNQENPANSALFINYETGKGYLYANSSNITLSFSGALQTSEVDLTGLSKTTGMGEGYQLLGNPFPSALDFGSCTRTNVNGVASILKKDGTGYATRSALLNEVIPANQGFFVEVSSEPGSISFPLSACIHSNQSFSLKSGISDLKLHMYIDPARFVETRIMLNDMASDDYDYEYDAHYIPPFSAAIPQLFSQTESGESLSLNSFNLIDEKDIQLQIRVPVSNTYDLLFEGLESFDAGTGILLEDKKLGITYNLRQINPVNISPLANDSTNRFVLHFKNSSASIDSEIKNDLNIYSNGNKIMIDHNEPADLPAGIEIYTLLGQKVFTERMLLTGHTIISLNVPMAAYFIKITTEVGVYTKQIIITK